MSGNNSLLVIETINKFLEMTETYKIDTIHAFFSSLDANTNIIDPYTLFNTLIEGTSDKKNYILLNIFNSAINANNAEIFSHFIRLLPRKTFDTDISEYYNNKEKSHYIYTFIINACINNNALEILNLFIYYLGLNSNKIHIILDICVSQSKSNPSFAENALMKILQHINVSSYINRVYPSENFTDLLLTACYDIHASDKVKIQILEIIFEKYKNVIHVSKLNNFDITNFYTDSEFILILLQKFAGFKEQYFYKDLKYNFGKIFARSTNTDSLAPIKIAAYLNAEERLTILSEIQVKFTLLYDNFKEQCERLFDHPEFITLAFKYPVFSNKMKLKNLLYIIQKYLDSNEEKHLDNMTKVGLLLTRIGIDEAPNNEEYIALYNICITNFKEKCQSYNLKIKTPLYFADLTEEQTNLSLSRNSNMNKLFKLFTRFAESDKNFDQNYISILKNEANMCSPLGGLCFGLASTFILAQLGKSDIYNTYKYLKKLNDAEIQDISNRLENKALTSNDLKILGLYYAFLENILPLHGNCGIIETSGNIITENNFVNNIYFQVLITNTDRNQIFQSLTHIFKATDLFESSNIQILHVTDILKSDARAFLVTHMFITGHTIAVFKTDDPEIYLIYDPGFFIQKNPMRVYKENLVQSLIRYGIFYNFCVYKQTYLTINEDIKNNIKLGYSAYLKQERLDLSLIIPLKLKQQPTFNLTAYQNHQHTSNQNTNTFDATQSLSSTSRHTTKYTT